MNCDLPGSRLICRAAVAAWISVLSAGCATSQIDASRTSPGFTGPGFGRILILGLAERPDVRQLYEDAFVRELALVGVTGLASHTRLTDVEMTDQAAIDLAAAQAGADAVLVTRLVKVESRDVIVPPEPGVQSRIDSAWPGTYTPVVAGQTQIVTLETRLFGAGTNPLVWSATTRTFDAADWPRAVASVSRALVQEMAKRKLLRRGWRRSPRCTQ